MSSSPFSPSSKRSREFRGICFRFTSPLITSRSPIYPTQQGYRFPPKTSRVPLEIGSLNKSTISSLLCIVVPSRPSPFALTAAGQHFPRGDSGGCVPSLASCSIWRVIDLEPVCTGYSFAYIHTRNGWCPSLLV
jgi:hypothetical protein